MVSERLKQVVFKHLYRELGNVEIIPYKDSIWLIDREKEHWYFEFEKDGRLWWRYGFFINFFEKDIQDLSVRIALKKTVLETFN